MKQKGFNLPEKAWLSTSYVVTLLMMMGWTMLAGDKQDS